MITNCLRNPSTNAVPRDERSHRDERDRLQAALRHQLGQQLDALHAPDTAARADQLNALNQDLTRRLEEAASENATFRARITALEEDLIAARTSLRRMIRTENTAR
ncbi:hypothetical protein [Streptomyces althioticus]|uniref:hypothetical protein n=1 Tax=Streptomyces althioticus TaxID=83380 RepID=UPI00341312DB